MNATTNHTMVTTIAGSAELFLGNVIHNVTSTHFTNVDNITSSQFPNVTDMTRRGRRKGMPPQTSVEEMAIRYTAAAVSLLGVILNLFTFILILRTPLRKYSSCIYIASQCITECGHHSFVFILYTRHLHGYGIFDLRWACQFSRYFQHAFLFLSIWYLVCYAFDHVFYRWSTSVRQVFCTSFRAKLVVLSLAIVSIYGHIYYMWTTSTFNRWGTCSPDNRYHEVVLFLKRVNVAFTILLPYILFFVLLAIAIYKDVYKYRLDRAVRERESTTQVAETSLLTTQVHNTSISHPPPLRANAIFYVVIPMTIVLCLPFNVISYINVFRRGGKHIRLPIHMAHAMNYVMNLLDFAYNAYFTLKPIVYYMVSPLLRHYACCALRAMCCKPCARKHKPELVPIKRVSKETETVDMDLTSL